jgi:hypothetical protein
MMHIVPKKIEAKKDPMSQFEEIEVRQDSIYANTKAGDPLVPIDDILHPNRNRRERRKAEALARRNRRKGRWGV